MAFLDKLPQLLGQRIRKYSVPGASLAILRGSRVVATAASGVTSLETKIPVSDQTLFQIGSITKPMTASLIMQLVDEGEVDLDTPVQRYLPGFRVADLTVARQVTLRHFLSHQSGIDGDFFVDAGRGDDNSQRLLEMATMMPSLFPIGERLSYCNLGFVALGRIIEEVYGMPWDDVIRERLFDPLGMEQAFTRPEDGIRFSCAIGHVPSRRRQDVWYPTRVPYLSTGQKAAGATPTMTATDLLRFARMHMDGGKNERGDKVLLARSVNAMQKRQIRVPKYFPAGLTGWGLGWMLMDLGGRRVYGHDGGTIGQNSFLRIVPEKNLAVALLTNGGDTGGLARDMLGDILKSMASASVPDFPVPDPELAPDVEPYTGTYENLNGRFEITARARRLRVDWQPNGGAPSGIPAGSPLAFFGDHAAVLDTDDEILNRTTFLFSGVDGGKARYLNFGTRVYRRVS